MKWKYIVNQLCEFRAVLLFCHGYLEKGQPGTPSSFGQPGSVAEQHRPDSVIQRLPELRRNMEKLGRQ
jgi:hypothetical protein